MASPTAAFNEANPARKAGTSPVWQYGAAIGDADGEGEADADGSGAGDAARVAGEADGLCATSGSGEGEDVEAGVPVVGRQPLVAAANTAPITAMKTSPMTCPIAERIVFEHRVARTGRYRTSPEMRGQVRGLIIPVIHRLRCPQ